MTLHCAIARAPRSLIAMLIACAGLVGPSRTRAWGPEGHQIVADVAERQLTPLARAEIAKLLGPGIALPDVANYTDSYRSRCRNTGPWHYVNIPLDAASYDQARDCPATAGGCIVSVLLRQIAILKDHTAPGDDREFALRMIVHLVGDLHQPMHSSNDADRGGNDRKLRFDGRDSNLHKLWDLDLIRASGRSEETYARYVIGSVLRRERRPLQQGGVVDWALEAHEVARRFAYGKLPHPSAGVLELGDDYARAVADALDMQLLRAGLRLAQVLNDAFAAPGPRVSPDLLAQNRVCTP